jgi:chemotaxis protein methyltransferase CheR
MQEFIQSHYGVKMPPEKKIFLETRLAKRLRLLNMNKYRDYLDYLFSDEGLVTELDHMVDLITTHKTDFFREPYHFDYLTQNILPEFIRSEGTGIHRTLKIWSAGCSTGEEPYTIAMILEEYASRFPGINFDYFILGSDVSLPAVEEGKRAIYPIECVQPIPDFIKRRYLMRSKDEKRDVVRIVPEVRAKVRFRQINFLEGDFQLRDKMDIIFCRNVMIYFDKKLQEILVNRFADYLNPLGYLFIGHSESLNNITTPFKCVSPTIYRKTKQ